MLHLLVDSLSVEVYHKEVGQHMDRVGSHDGKDPRTDHVGEDNHQLGHGLGEEIDNVHGHHHSSHDGVGFYHGNHHDEGCIHGMGHGGRSHQCSHLLGAELGIENELDHGEHPVES